MSEAKKCPKCGGEMESGRLYGYAGFPVGFWANESKARLSLSRKTVAYVCKTCGYVEIYRKA